ncbi:hypothetical protein PUNSTDRAFT_49209 [Punctularia strigosozonata HHB-11173 SS5]|uniref:uncharacterized protein n=1 Tax=Punctularia strigosozonata (strain HHB-11173) TaxID=741275 RepID=UPI00044164C2|nr:uncharacterized protein PUNSTDRAFT_49209 [Punctularia strigosozonata HHB-11173 SS5]EIN14415.1 hypothetical protein PUNSTDRAFT_49209 [Punctularia strigosozonata HHB-11173 SS5]
MDSTPEFAPPASPVQDSDASKKGPRHRHRPDQVQQLMALYERDDHPSLEDRTALGQRIGMPTRTVNAWFQNRRAALRKRAERESSRAAVAPTAYHVPAHPGHGSLALFSRPPSPAPSSYAYDDDDEGSYTTSDELPRPNQRIVLSPAPSAYSDDRHTWQFADDAAAGLARKVRNRPTQAQHDELRNLYSANPHPSREERERLGERIGMRYQSITNWFQNQRSLAKKRREDEASDVREREYAAFPPASSHPSLSSSSLLARSESLTSMHSRSRSPYPSTASSQQARPRRSRPEPYQLDALKALYAKTPNPSIEERGALALEIGMELGRVTNWFRNLRQTAKKRGLRHHAILASGEADDDEADGDDDDVSVGIDFSRDGTPSMFGHEDAYASREHKMEVDDAERHSTSAGTDDEQHEALTPSSSPPPPSSVPRDEADDDYDMSHFSPRELTFAALEHLARMKDMEMETLKTISAVEVAGVRVEDALLLLTFTGRRLEA